nr:immunoglobulin light chain junction region [Macaca mulatta]
DYYFAIGHSSGEYIF